MSHHSHVRAAISALAFVVLGCSSDRATAPDAASLALASGTPTSFSVWASSDVQLNLSWTDNSPNETGIEIHRATNGPTGSYTLLTTVAPNVMTYANAGLTPNTQYCYKVRAVRTRGGKSTYSDFTAAQCATTFGKPDVPANVSATPGEWGTVGVTWTASATAIGYRVQRSATGADPWELVATTSAVSWSDGGRPLEQQVCYRVSAYNTWGESAPSAVDCTAPPAAPASILAAGNSAGSIDVSWARSEVADGYELQRAGSDYAFTVIATLPATSLSYRDSPPLANTPYWYRVRAKKDGGYSAFSNWDDAIAASTPPNTPSGTRVVAGSSTQVYVYWTDNSDNEEGFRIERSTDGGATWPTSVSTGRDQGVLNDYGLTPDQNVCYRVSSFNGRGYSSPSPSPSPACTTPPKAPYGVGAVASPGGVITVTWHDDASVADGYEVQRVECYDGGYYGYSYCSAYTIATVEAGVMTWQDTGLTPGYAFTYQVVAFRYGSAGSPEKGYSDPSEQVSETAQP